MPTENLGLAMRKSAISLPPTMDVKDEDGYTLSGFGDIESSNIQFIPGPPTALTPIRTEKLGRDARRPASEGKERRPSPVFIRKIVPPSASKRSIRRSEPAIETTPFNSKHSSEKTCNENFSTANTEMSGLQSQGLIDSLDVGLDPVILKESSHDVVENSDRPRAPVSAMRWAAGMVRNGASASAVIAQKYHGLRGNGKLPKRPPIPQWDPDGNLGTKT